MRFKQNLAVVGAGYWGKNLVRNFADIGSLHTVCDNNIDSLNYIKNKLLEEYKAVQLILASEGKYKSTVKRKRSY